MSVKQSKIEDAADSANTTQMSVYPAPNGQVTSEAQQLVPRTQPLVILLSLKE
jgi:hypothetical protein